MWWSRGWSEGADSGSPVLSDFQSVTPVRQVSVGDVFLKYPETAGRPAPRAWW